MTIIKPIVFSALVLSCAACSFDVPSKLDNSRVEIVESVHNSRFETDALDDLVVKSIAHEYMNSGNGNIEVTVTYDPKSKKNTAMKATNEAKRIADVLTSSGVKVVETKLMPVVNSWNMSHTFVSYAFVSAQSPSECEDLMPGFESTHDVGDNKKHMDYSYGCTVEAMLANQVAYPADMLGQNDNTDTDSGRRAENVIAGRGYYGFDQYPELGGESSSDD